MYTVHIINLYKPWDSEPLSARVGKSRWRMIGHVVRGPDNGPPWYLQLIFCIWQGDLDDLSSKSNLFSLIKRLKLQDLCLNNMYDLNYPRNIAFDRANWCRMQVL